MGFRVVFIESEVKMSLKLNNLIVNKGEGDIWIPLDDISMVVIDNLKTSLSARMLKIVPPAGNVRTLMITEKQYEDIKIMVGTKQALENAIGNERMIII